MLIEMRDGEREREREREMEMVGRPREGVLVLSLWGSSRVCALTVRDTPIPARSEEQLVRISM